MNLRHAKIECFFAALLPPISLGWRAFHSGLGANPIEVITHSTGQWTIIFLLLTLSVTPLRRVTRQYWLIGLRRMVGLFAFFYATLHFTTYFWLDKFFDVHEIVKDIYKRPFITVGFAAFTLLVPLALTSTAWSIRKLGGKNWQRLHRLIYLSAILGVIHFIWLVKADKRQPYAYGFVLTLLLAYRGWIWFSARRERLLAGSAPRSAGLGRI